MKLIFRQESVFANATSLITDYHKRQYTRGLTFAKTDKTKIVQSQWPVKFNQYLRCTFIKTLRLKKQKNSKKTNRKQGDSFLNIRKLTILLNQHLYNYIEK